MVWRDLDLLLDDNRPDRVIRGPGGTLLGGGAMTALSTSITKDSKIPKGFMEIFRAGSLVYPTQRF